MRFISIFFIVVGIHPVLGALRNSPDTILAKRYYVLGDSLFRNDKHDSSLVYFNKAMTIYEKANDWGNIVDCLNRISRCYAYLSYYDRSIEFANRALQLNEVKLPEDVIGIIHANYNLGYSSLRSGNLSRAKEYLHITLSLSKKKGDKIYEGLAYRELGLAEGLETKSNEAIPDLKKAILILLQVYGNPSKDLASAYNYMAIVLREQADYDGAKTNLKKAAEALKGYPDSNLLANIYVNMANVYDDLGEYDMSLETNEKALTISKKLFGEHSINAANIYNNVGLVLIERGYYNRAIEYLEKAVEIRKQNNQTNDVTMQYLYQNIGDAYARMGYIHLDLEYQQRALVIAERLEDKEDKHLALMYLYIGESYTNIGDYSKAFYYLKKSEKSITENLSKMSSSHALINVSLGEYYKKTKNFSAAIEYYSKAIKLFEISSGKNHPTIGDCNTAIAQCYELVGRKDISYRYYEKALKIFEFNYGNKSHALARILNSLAARSLDSGNYTTASRYLLRSFDANNFQLKEFECLDQNTLLKSLIIDAQIQKFIFNKTKNQTALDSCLSLYLISDKLINKMRRTDKAYSDRILFSENMAEIYDGAIKSFLLKYNTDHNLEYLKTAFFFSERSKSNVLAETAADLSARKISGIPKAILNFENELKADESLLQSKLREATIKEKGYNTKIVNEYTGKLFEAKRRSDSLVGKIEKNFPDYYRLKYDQHIVSVDNVQKNILPGSALIEYFIGDNNIYCFVVTPKQFKLFSIIKDTLFQTAFNGLQEQLGSIKIQNRSSNGFKQFVTSASTLYDLILKQPLDFISQKEKIIKLVIIPDGSLCYIPFDLLLKTNHVVEFRNYKNLDYLIKDYQIRYEYSATVGFKNHTNTSEQRNYLAFAPSFMEIEKQDSTTSEIVGRFRNSITPLMWNQYEVKSLSNRIGGDYYLAGDATESRFKQEAPKYDIIHLATHALVDDQDPMNSKFVFAPNKDSVEDGYLYAFELYNMKLNAHMAVLSACNTGYGKLMRGEGIMSLARAFSYAGVPSVVMSHWPVDDKATAQLMDLFYKYLADGLSKDEAMQKAKIEFLRDADDIRQNPRFWAGFVVLGDASSIIFKKSFMERYALWMTSAFSLLLLISILIFFKKREIKN